MAPRWHKCPCGPPNRRTLSRRDLGCPPYIAEDRRRLVDFIFITETVTYVYLKLPENSLGPRENLDPAAARPANSQLRHRAVRPKGGRQAASVGISRSVRRNDRYISTFRL